MSEQWTDEAFWAAKKVLRYYRKPFLTERLLKDVASYIGLPKDGRLMGPVVQRLERERIIEKAGMLGAKTSNGGIKYLWRKV